MYVCESTTKHVAAQPPGGNTQKWAGSRQNMYAVKELFKSLQGEGGNTGRTAMFCRFSGCNLWSGREEDRASAACRICDTDFTGTDGPGGGSFADAPALADRLAALWGAGLSRRFVVFTGGEPLLQLDPALVAACHNHSFELAIETNGTRPPPSGIDWVCVSPKSEASWTHRSGDELKLVYPHPELDPARLLDLPFRLFWLQPVDGPDREANIAAAADYCLSHPGWRLSLQTHKMIGLP